MPSSTLGLYFLLTVGTIFLQYLLFFFLWSVFLSLAVVEIDVELCNGCWDIPSRIPFMNKKYLPEVLINDYSQIIIIFFLEVVLSLWQLPCSGILLIPWGNLNQMIGWGEDTKPQPQCLNSGLLWRGISQASDLNATSVEILYSLFTNSASYFLTVIFIFIFNFFPEVLLSDLHANLRVLGNLIYGSLFTFTLLQSSHHFFFIMHNLFLRKGSWYWEK